MRIKLKREREPKNIERGKTRECKREVINTYGYGGGREMKE